MKETFEIEEEPSLFVSLECKPLLVLVWIGLLKSGQVFYLLLLKICLRGDAFFLHILFLCPKFFGNLPIVLEYLSLLLLAGLLLIHRLFLFPGVFGHKLRLFGDVQEQIFPTFYS